MEAAETWNQRSEEALRPAGAAPRAVAVLIDAVLAAVFVGFPATIALGDRVEISSPAGNGVFWEANNDVLLVSAALTLAYFVAFEAMFGATIGKLVLSLRVRNLDGSAIDVSAAFLRNVLRIVDCFPYFVPYLLGAVSIWTSDDRQRVGDRVAETVVTWR